MDADDPVTFEPVRDYNSVMNAVDLGTKRSLRRARPAPWERHIDAVGLQHLDRQRAAVDELETLYENLHTDSVYRELALQKIALERLVSRLMRQALESQVSAHSATAQDHSLAWKVFDNMSTTRQAVPIPPTALVDHFESVMAPKNNPATAIVPTCELFIGPLTEEDAKLCSPFTEDELQAAVDQINLDSAPGPDGYPPKLVRGLFFLRAFFLFFLTFVNYCFSVVWVPLAWCCSEAFVLPKGKGDPTSGDSYRAIALCSIFAKLYERLLLFRVHSWWKNSKLFKLSQFGFRSSSSTLDAVFVLRALINFVCRVHRSPLHACFIDLRKAFPSVSRSSLFSRLLLLGIPRPLVAAISSFYNLNIARLRIGRILSRPFVVTLGLLEGSILSPLLFSIVFSFVWEVVDPSAFPWSDNVFRVDGVWILAFADDLVILSPSRIKLAETLIKLDSRFPDYNLAINLAKTEVMTFFPRGSRHTTQTMVTVRGHDLRNVNMFSYLGIQLTDTSSLKSHLEVVLQRAKVSLFKITDLLLTLSITDVTRLHCYFQTFVQSQLYGLELIPYSKSLVDRLESLRSLFVRRMFRLPQGTPTELFYVLFPSLHPSLLCLKRRHSFFTRALKHDLCVVPDAFIFDASLMSRGCGWFYELFDFYRSICQRVNLSDFDFACDVPDLLSLVRDESSFAFSHLRASAGSSMSFFRLIRRPEGLHSFRTALSTLSAPHQHVVLCFTANQMRWTFLTSPRHYCPLCGLSWSWEHFFSCVEVAPVLDARQLSLSSFRSKIVLFAWDQVYKDLAHVLLVWAFVLSRDPCLELTYSVDVFKSLMSCF